MPKLLKRLILAAHSQAGLLLVTVLVVAYTTYFVTLIPNKHPIIFGLAALVVGCQYGAVVQRIWGCALIITMLFAIPIIPFIMLLLKDYQDAARGLRPMPEVSFAIMAMFASFLMIALVMGAWAYRLQACDKGLPDPITGKRGHEQDIWTDWGNRYFHMREAYPPQVADMCGHHRIRRLVLMIFEDHRYGDLCDLVVEFESGKAPGLAFFAVEDSLSKLLDQPIRLLSARMQRIRNTGRVLAVRRNLYPNGHRPRALRPSLPPMLSPAGYPITLDWLTGGPPPPAWTDKPTEPSPRPDLPREPVAEFCRTHHIRRLLLIDPVWRRSTLADDIDLVAEFAPGHAPGLEFFGLEQELSALVDRRVDLRTPGFLSPRVRDPMLASARVLHEAQ